MRIPLVIKRTLAVLFPDGKLSLVPNTVTSREAATILGCSVRTVQAMCERGVFLENIEWRKISTRGARGEYRISREAVERLLLGD